MERWVLLVLEGVGILGRRTGWAKAANNIMHLKRQKDSRMAKAQSMNFLKDHMFFPVKSQGHLMQTAILHVDFV